MLHNDTCKPYAMFSQERSTNVKIYEHEHWTCFEGCRAVDHPLVGRWPIESCVSERRSVHIGVR
jgi:hypothetical protein